MDEYVLLLVLLILRQCVALFVNGLKFQIRLMMMGKLAEQSDSPI